jgi:hypothetical protein
MLQMLKEEEWDVVAGNRKNRKDGMMLRKFPSMIANALIRRMTGVYIRDYGCTLKVFRREIAEDLGLYGELHRFIPVLAKLQGARITQVDVKHHARQFGKSKYGINRTFKVLSDLVLMVFFRKYMQKPIHLFGTMGFISLGLGILINMYLLLLKIMGRDIWGKPLMILGLILLLGGIQLITIGILSEISVRTYFESQNKKNIQHSQSAQAPTGAAGFGNNSVTFVFSKAFLLLCRWGKLMLPGSACWLQTIHKTFLIHPPNPYLQHSPKATLLCLHRHRYAARRQVARAAGQ